MSTAPAIAPTHLSWETAIAQLQGSDLSERYYAAWYLGTTRDPRSVEPLLLALQDEADRTALGGYPLRRNAAKALGAIGDRRAVAGLLAALDCSDLHVREEVAYALAQLGDPRAIPALQHCFQDPMAEQPWEALIEALGHLGDPQAATWVRPFLTHASERVQSAAAWVIYRQERDPSLTRIWVRLLHSESVSLRQAALLDMAEAGWLEGGEVMVGADVAVNLRLNALKRLFDVALSLVHSPTGDGNLESTQGQVTWVDLATPVVNWIDQLL